MVERAKTKDEMFMIRLFEEASKVDDIDQAFDRYVIGAFVGLQAKAVDTICVLLAQANFIKKKGAIDVSITPHGIKLVQNIKFE